MPGLVTASLEDYERLALALAQEPGRLQSTRAALLRQRADSTLFDTAAFTQGVEAAYERMWARCASGERPEAFSLSVSDLR
jgi:predicted O-linked N-acetylglucosamine transferase (SPINDLY family)